jgi:hypothetical protein
MLSKLLFFIIIFAPNVWAQNVSFLGNQHTLIRLILGDGAGLGHQSAGMVTLRRLRELGFQGPVEIVLSDTADAPIRASKSQKYEALIPGFDPNGDDPQTLNTLLGELKVYSNYQFQLDKPKRVKVAIAVGTRGGRHLDFSHDLTHYYRADYVLKLAVRGPFGEYGPSYIQQSEDKVEVLQDVEDAAFFTLSSLAFNPAGSIDLIAQQSQEFPNFSADAPALMQIFKLRSEINLLAAYGLHNNGPLRLVRLISALSHFGALTFAKRGPPTSTARRNSHSAYESI